MAPLSVWARTKHSTQKRAMLRRYVEPFLNTGLNYIID